MRIINIIKFLVLLSAISSCDSAIQIDDAEMERKANRIVIAFDTTSINLFVDWDFSYRGQNINWTRNIGDEDLYTCVYRKKNDFTKFMIVDIQGFLQENDFPISIDSSIWRILIDVGPNDDLSIIGIDNHGQDRTIISDISRDSFFMGNDPLSKFEDFSNLAESLELYESNYTERIGGIVQFSISAHHILTYVPDLDSLNPGVKDIWLKSFSKGTWINSKWNLRKVDHAID